jgi:hypothetical protein
VKNLRAFLFVMLIQAVSAQAPLPGSVEGNVRSSETFEAVAGGIVELRDLNQSGTPKAVAISDAKGDFIFSGVVPGRYRIIVSRNGFASRQGPLVLVSPGQKVSLAPLPLFPGASVSGRVSYPNGEPMPIVGVSLLKASYQDNGHASFVEIASQITNDQGEFRFFWLPPGTFYLKAESARNNMQTTFLLNPNGNGTISAAGMLSSSRSMPRLSSDLGLNEDQTYVGLYYPGTSDWQRATPLELHPGTELRNLNIAMNPEVVLRIRGVAINQSTQQPAQGSVVASLRPIDPVSGELGPYASYLQFNQGGGVFEFRGVFSGRYEIRATADGLSGRSIADIRGVDADVRVNLVPPVTLTGKMKAEGAPVDFSNIRIGIAGDGVAVAANGDFSFPNVAIAAYTVTAKFPPTLPDAYIESNHFQNADITRRPLIIEAGPPSALDVVISASGGSIEGNVLNSRGEAVPGSTVLLVPDQAGTNPPELYQNAVANSSGKFEFHALHPGSYFLYAWTDIEKNSWFAPSFLRDFESFRKSVQVVAGQKLQPTVNAAPAN